MPNKCWLENMAAGHVNNIRSANVKVCQYLPNVLSILRVKIGVLVLTLFEIDSANLTTYPLDYPLTLDSGIEVPTYLH